MINETPTEKPFLSPRTYDLLKKMVQIVLPALATLYFTIAKILDLPGAEEVMGILAAVATFGGTLLGISKSRFDSSETRYVGETFLADTEDGPKRVFNVTADVIPMNRKELSFKVLDSAA